MNGNGFSENDLEFGEDELGQPRFLRRRLRPAARRFVPAPAMQRFVPPTFRFAPAPRYGVRKDLAAKAVEAVRAAALTGQPIVVERREEIPALRAAIRKVGVTKLRVITPGPAPKAFWVKPTAASPFMPELLAYQEAEREAQLLMQDAARSGIDEEDLDTSLGQGDWFEKIMGQVTEFGPAAAAARDLLKGTSLGQKLARFKIRTPRQLQDAYRQGKMKLAEYNRARQVFREAVQQRQIAPEPKYEKPPREERKRSWIEVLFNK